MTGNNGYEVNVTSEIILNIKSQINQMNPAQIKIARFILKNPEKIAGMAIGELAACSKVSEATVSRFVKYLGFSNYRMFQAEMVKSSVLNSESIRGYSEVKKTDSTYQICKKIFDSNIQNLADTLSCVNVKAIEKAARVIVKSKKISIFAQGRSMVTATSIRQRLYRLGITCNCYSDSHEQAIVASLMKSEDVVIGISTFGRSKTVLKNLRYGVEQGAFSIGVSSYKGTPLEKIVDIMLISASNDSGNFGMEPSCSTVSQMVILDCLYIMIANLMDAEAKRCFRVTCDAIESERE